MTLLNELSDLQRLVWKGHGLNHLAGKVFDAFSDHFVQTHHLPGLLRVLRQIGGLFEQHLPTPSRWAGTAPLSPAAATKDGRLSGWLSGRNDQKLINKLRVGGFNPVEKILVRLIHLPYVGLNIKQVWKPPPRSIWLMLLATWDVGFCACWLIIAPLTNCTGLGFAYFLPWPFMSMKQISIRIPPKPNTLCVNTPWNWRFCFKNLVSNFGANLGTVQIAFSLLISS